MRTLILTAALAFVPVAGHCASPTAVRIDMTRSQDAARQAACEGVQRDLLGPEDGSPASIGARQAYARLGCREVTASTEDVPKAVDACTRMRQRLDGEIAGFKRIDLSEDYARRCAG